jgi:hypothetical protein
VRRYDANGRLLMERVTELTGVLRSQSDYTSPGAYDAAGNLLFYVVTDATSVSQIVTTQGKMDGYVRTALVDTKTVNGQARTASTTTYSFNANSGLASSAYTEKAGAAAVTTSYIRTINNGVLQTVVGAQTSRNLRVGSHVYASWSSTAASAGTSTPVHVDTHTPRIQNFDESGNAMVQVQSGETLQSLAQMAYGDSSLWYVIANANGISNNTGLTVGAYLTIPTESNGTSLHSDYGWSGAATSTDSNFWDVVPGSGGDDGGCGGIGSIVMVVVAVAVTVFAPEFIPALGEMVSAGGAMEVAGYAAAAALGSVASQAVGNAIGAEDGFSWQQVGLAAVAGGVTGGIGGANGAVGAAAGGGTSGAIAAAAVSNVITQGVSVAVGLQDSFSWKSVVAAAVGAGVGSVISSSLQSSSAFAETFGSASKYVGAGISSFAAGVSASIATGGRVNVTQVAADAFGNALGSSLADQMQQGSQQEQQLTFAQDVANRRASNYWSPSDTVDNWDSSVMGGGDSPNSPTSSITLNAENTDNQSLINANNLATMPDYYGNSVDGQSYVAGRGDSISSILGTSNPQAVGNFMRANGLTNSNLVAGNNYFIPDSTDAYGDNSTLGQTTLNTDNARISQALAAQNDFMSQEDAGNLYMQLGGRGSETTGKIAASFSGLGDVTPGNSVGTANLSQTGASPQQFGIVGWSDPSGPPDSLPIKGLTVTHDVPADAVKYAAPDGEKFFAPPSADFPAMYAAGKSAGMNPFAINSAVGHFGTYDFQRDSSQDLFIRPYTDASNYAVGVYMNGAGFSLDQTVKIASTFANLMSKNAGTPDQVNWWTRGWNAANAQALPKKP